VIDQQIKVKQLLTEETKRQKTLDGDEIRTNQGFVKQYFDKLTASKKKQAKESLACNLSTFLEIRAKQKEQNQKARLESRRLNDAINEHYVSTEKIKLARRDQVRDDL
jgi:hypothetical protein